MSLKTYFSKNRKRLRKRKRLIAFLSIIAVLGLSTATYAWFTVNTFAGVDPFEMTISTGEQLLVSMENHGPNLDLYTKEITNDMINSYLKKYNTSIKEMLLAPVTTNNGSDFYYQHRVAAKPNTGKSYLEYECYFIATCDMWVHLTTEGDVDNTGKGTLVTTNESSPKNKVIQAIRTDFQTADNGVATYEPNKGGSASTSLATFDLPSGTMVYNNGNRLFHLDEMTPKKVTVRLWAEGEDPQCDDDVQEAQFKMQLSFVGCDENGNPIS